MKKRLVTASTDPNGLLPFVPNDLSSQIPPKPWVSDPRQPFPTSIVSQLVANMPTSSKTEHIPSNGDENRDSPGFTSPMMNNQSRYISPKKSDLIGQTSFNTNQLIEAILHNSQLDGRGATAQQHDLGQVLLEMVKSQQQQQQILSQSTDPQTANRPIPPRATPDKLLITSRSPPLRSPSETIRGFVDGNHSKPRNSYSHSPVIQSPPPHSIPPAPISSLSVNSVSSRNQPQPLQIRPPNVNTDYNATTSALYNQFLCMMAQQQQQQIRGQHQASQISSQISLPSHSESEKMPTTLVGYPKVGMPSNNRTPTGTKYDSYASQLRPPSHDPYIRAVPPTYYPSWTSSSNSTNKMELSTSSSAPGGSIYSTIDILRESKQVSESVKPTNKMLTTSGVFYPEKQTVPPLPPQPPQPQQPLINNQSDAVDHHFRMSLGNSKTGLSAGIKSEALNHHPPPLVDLTIEKKPSKKNHLNYSGVGVGVSSCSSSSSISSMSVLDRDAASPNRKPPFLLPPPKTENRINSEACSFSLKKRLIQRYQADATTEQASECVKQEQPLSQIAIKQENSVKLEPSSPLNHVSLGDSVKVKDEHNLPRGHESPGSTVSGHSTMNGSLPVDTLKETSKSGTNNTARRHPPVRASKINPLSSLNESSMSPSSTSSPGKRPRGSAAKHHTGLTSVRKRPPASTGNDPSMTASSKHVRGKTTKPKFYSSRVASSAATNDTTVNNNAGRRNRVTSLRSTTDQTHSEFDFNGQDDDEVPEVSVSTETGKTNRRWFGSRKRKSNIPAAGPLLRIKVPRRLMYEDEASRTTKRPRQSQQRNQLLPNKQNDSNGKNASFSEDEEANQSEGSNDDDLEKTIRAEQDDEQDQDEDCGDDEGESIACHRCGQLVKLLKAGRSTDPYDYHCTYENKLSIQEIAKRLPAPPNLAILSHRSLCGGELGGQDTDDTSSESEVPFLQLNSCTELEKLKPSSRCRACREASRVSSTTTVETNSNSDVNHGPTSDKNGSRRRGINNRNNSNNANSRGNHDNEGDSKAAAATISVFCRFWGFRKLFYDQKGQLNVSDFCRTSEADSVDRSLWTMHRHVSPPLSRHNAIYCLDRLGAIACRLMLSELSILSSSAALGSTVLRQCCPPSPPSETNKKSSSTHSTPSRLVAWKRPVQGVREMCDVCETTMFNSHWVCTKCGYSVCSACYYAKANALPSSKLAKDSPDPLGDATSSVASTTHESVADDDCVKSLSSAVIELSYEDYTVRQPWSTCSASRRPHDPSKMMLTALLPYGSLHYLWHRLHRIVPRLDCPCSQSSSNHSDPLNPISSIEGQHSPASSTDTSAATSLDLLADLALKSTTSSGGSPEGDIPNMDVQMLDVSDGRREPNLKAGASGVLYLKDGDSTNLKAFQRHWATNQPVLISGCGRNFNSSLWTAKSLSRENGSGSNNSQIVLIDCETHLIVLRYPIRAFWEAFESHPNSNSTKRSSKEKAPHFLKVREWPPAGDLSEAFPDRYADFTEHLPLPEYTHREGQLNLAARLPSFFVRPDLGPRLHIAHDLTSQPKIGTMNLRVDVTDVINVLMHATRSMDQVPPKGSESQLRAFLRQAGVDLNEVFHAKSPINPTSNRGMSPFSVIIKIN
ncbi:unnamed protein product [Rodentolepis nana]|uniref:Protein kinase domain-containing protein n=1 Tax=Rodentolepis nana TaxID=102285 RepID=A0A0R3T0J3_RODNA|nr:unnamed protein product [Rodentolepis nana]